MALDDEKRRSRVELVLELLSDDSKDVPASSSAIVSQYYNDLPLRPGQRRWTSDFGVSVHGRVDGDGPTATESWASGEHARYIQSLAGPDDGEEETLDTWDLTKFVAAVERKAAAALASSISNMPESDRMETRSMPDLSRPRVDSTLSGAEPERPPSRLKIVKGRRRVAPRARSRTQSLMALGGRASPAASMLDSAFKPLDEFEDSMSVLATNQSSPPQSRRSSFFGGDGLAAPVHSRTMSLAAAPELVLAASQSDDDGNKSDSWRAPSRFTSRCDPAVREREKAALAKGRPVFKQSFSGPPRVLVMPAALVDSPPSPARSSPVIPPRREGPDTDDAWSSDDESRVDRPAGLLYGRSLMDVLEERKAALKAKARKPEIVKSDSAGTVTVAAWRGKEAYGDDLVWEKDMEKAKEMEKIEAIEKAAKLAVEEERLRRKREQRKLRKPRPLSGKDANSTSTAKLPFPSSSSPVSSKPPQSLSSEGSFSDAATASPVRRQRAHLPPSISLQLSGEETHLDDVLKVIAPPSPQSPVRQRQVPPHTSPPEPDDSDDDEPLGLRHLALQPEPPVLAAVDFGDDFNAPSSADHASESDDDVPLAIREHARREREASDDIPLAFTLPQTTFFPPQPPMYMAAYQLQAAQVQMQAWAATMQMSGMVQPTGADPAVDRWRMSVAQQAE